MIAISAKRGMTLMEVLVALAILLIIGNLILLIVVKGKTVQRQNVRRLDMVRELAAAVERIRLDVKASAAAPVTNGKVTLSGPDGQVAYELRGGWLRRTVNDGKDARAKKLGPKMAAATFVTDEHASGAVVVTLVCEQPARPGVRPLGLTFAEASRVKTTELDRGGVKP